MPVLLINEQLKGSNKVSTHLQGKRPNVYGEKTRQRISTRLLKKIATLPQARREKVLAVHRQLEAGTYGIKKRLDIAVDRFIETLIKEETEEDDAKETTQSRQK